MITDWNVLVTDTFGGAPNYAWVRRYTFKAPESARQAHIMRLAKRLAGLTNVKGTVQKEQDGYSFRPYNQWQIMLVVTEWPECDCGEPAAMVRFTHALLCRKCKAASR